MVSASFIMIGKGLSCAWTRGSYMHVTSRLPVEANLRAHSELSASPRKPNVATVGRSENSLSLEVWCLRASASKFSGSTPQPLSITSTSSEPYSLSLTSGAGRRAQTDVRVALMDPFLVGVKSEH